MAKRLTEQRVTKELNDDGDERFAVAKFVAQRGDAWWVPATGGLHWPTWRDAEKFSVVYERVAGKVSMRSRPL